MRSRKVPWTASSPVLTKKKNTVWMETSLNIACFVQNSWLIAIFFGQILIARRWNWGIRLKMTAAVNQSNDKLNCISSWNSIRCINIFVSWSSGGGVLYKTWGRTWLKCPRHRDTGWPHCPLWSHQLAGQSALYPPPPPPHTHTLLVNLIGMARKVILLDSCLSGVPADNIEAVSADDLLSVILYLLVKTEIPNWWGGEGATWCGSSSVTCGGGGRAKRGKRSLREGLHLLPPPSVSWFLEGSTLNICRCFSVHPDFSGAAKHSELSQNLHPSSRKRHI